MMPFERGAFSKNAGLRQGVVHAHTLVGGLVQSSVAQQRRHLQRQRMRGSSSMDFSI